MITPIEEMQKAGGAKEVEISGWDGETITVKLRRPALYEMAAAGQIPNPLLPVADALFMMNGTSVEKQKLDDLAAMMKLIAKEALVEPTMEELNEAGLTLTDMQYNEIYSFVIGGPKSLERFHHMLRDPAGKHGAADGVQSVKPARAGRSV